jgi:hypothetical protein
MTIKGSETQISFKMWAKKGKVYKKREQREKKEIELLKTWENKGNVRKLKAGKSKKGKKNEISFLFSLKASYPNRRYT